MSQDKYPSPWLMLLYLAVIIAAAVYVHHDQKRQSFNTSYLPARPLQ